MNIDVLQAACWTSDQITGNDMTNLNIYSYLKQTDQKWLRSLAVSTTEESRFFFPPRFFCYIIWKDGEGSLRFPLPKLYFILLMPFQFISKSEGLPGKEWRMWVSSITTCSLEPLFLSETFDYFSWALERVTIRKSFSSATNKSSHHDLWISSFFGLVGHSSMATDI